MLQSIFNVLCPSCGGAPKVISSASHPRQMSTQTMTPDERKEVAKLFSEIDTDGSGGLDIHEMKA